MNVHLFQTGSDLSMIGYFDRLERLQVELDPYNLKRLLESVVDDEWVELEHLKHSIPSHSSIWWYGLTTHMVMWEMYTVWQIFNTKLIETIGFPPLFVHANYANRSKRYLA